MTDAEQIGGKDKDIVDAFLEEALLARIATADPDTCQPHVVPVWYGWDGESIWISSYSTTRKVAELRKNPYCSIVIDVAEGDGNISALLLEGKAELVTGPADLLREKITWVYTRYLGEEGVLADDPQEWLASPDNLLIKLTPTKTYAW
jgi:PPOX class probable F420-dependent enzyme